MLKDDNQFPHSPDIAVLVGSLFTTLGGSLMIGPNGKRSRGLPMPGLWTDASPWPNLPGAKLVEQFHHVEEWAGALKVLDYLLVRLHPDDRSFVYDAFGAAYVDTAREDAR